MENDKHKKAIRATYTVEEISEILGVSIRKAYTICADTTLFKVMRLGKRCLRIHKESFDNWFDEQQDR